MVAPQQITLMFHLLSCTRSPVLRRTPSAGVALAKARTVDKQWNGRQVCKLTALNSRLAFRRPPRGVVSRGQVRTRLRLPLSPAAFLDRLEKGIKTKDILLQHLSSSTGPKIFMWGSLPRPSYFRFYHVHIGSRSLSARGRACTT